MRENDRHDAIRLQVIEIVKEEGVVRLALRRQPVRREARIGFLASRIPDLGVRRVRHDRVDIQSLIRGIRILILKVRPVVFQRVAVSRHDVGGQNAAHDEVHTREVIRVLLQFLGVVLDAVFLADIFRGAVADIDKERARAARRVIDLNMITILQMPGDDFRHQKRHFVGRIEFAGLFARVRREVADQVFVDEAENVVILLPVHRDVFDQVDEASDRL